jgi:hypothetical protein
MYVCIISVTCTQIDEERVDRKDKEFSLLRERLNGK